MVCNQTDNEKRNEAFMGEFREYIGNLSLKTINTHSMNIDLFLNNYLYQYEEMQMEDGKEYISGFMFEFFIPKCMWSSVATVKSTAASIKKFYKCMEEKGHVSQGYSKEVNRIVREGLDDWCEDSRRFDEGNEFFFLE